MTEHNELTPQQALNNLRIVSRLYRGTYDEHASLEKSIQLIEAFVHKDSEPEKEQKLTNVFPMPKGKPTI